MNELYFYKEGRDELRPLTKRAFDKYLDSSYCLKLYTSNGEVFATYPGAERSRKLDKQTPHISARRLLVDCYGELFSLEVINNLSVSLTRDNATIYILI